MAKLTKPQIRAHKEAVAILTKDKLSYDEREFVINNWQESATNINSASGAFFTPLELARNMAIEVPGGRIIDLCAGIGALSYAVAENNHRGLTEIVCIEINKSYADVGRKVMPDARWIVADAVAVASLGLGRFNCAISNPPYGGIKRLSNAPRYNGKDFEYHVIDAAADVADYGVFIVPQMSAGFRYSGATHYQRDSDGRARDFERKTGWTLGHSCGIDTSFARNLWRGVAPATEIVCVDYDTPVAANDNTPVQETLFGDAA